MAAAVEIPATAQRVVERAFGATRLAAGLALLDRVHLVKPPPWPVVARIGGAVVTVHYQLEGEVLRGDCTCDVGADCEYAAALALVALARAHELAAAEVEAARQQVVGEWLVELARAEDAPAPAPAAPANQAIAYLLDDRDGQFGLTVVQCARLRGGGLALGAPMAALADPQRGAPRWILAFLAGLELDRDRPALVVAPRSVLGNWAAEAARFVPGLRVAIHLGAERPDDPRELAPLTLTSYQTLVRDRELLSAVRWRTVFFDESQAVKNPDTQLRAAAAALDATSRFAVTGTPIENHLGELWSQLDLAIPGILGRRRGFDAIFRRPIERDAAATVLDHLRQRIRPFLLRRTKQHVEVELPPRTEIIERIDLDVAQRDLYESLRLSLDAGVRRALDDARVPGASMQILDALLKLRQCCCDPRLVALPAARRVTGSAKLERLLAKLEELDDAGRATLVFSQFTSMLALIERACADAGLATLVLTGATRDRDDVVRRFQAGEARLFLVSLKAGGVGLNLTRADTVIHYDPWWNPAAEAQASDRAHRIGQDKPVVIYKLVARGTVEDAICDLQEDKRRLSAVALRDGGVTHLAAADLQAVYRYAVQGSVDDDGVRGAARR